MWGIFNDVMNPLKNYTKPQNTKKEEEEEDDHMPLERDIFKHMVTPPKKFDFSKTLKTKREHITVIEEVPTQNRPIIQNVVATLGVGCRLDLKNIAERARNVEYNPQRFAAAIMRIRLPHPIDPDITQSVTALIFSSGRLVCTGAKSVEESRLAARKIVKVIAKLPSCYTGTIKFDNFTVQNIVGSVDIGFKLNLNLLFNDHKKLCTYEPELFPGLVYRLAEPKVVFLVFVSGKMVITGAKHPNEITKAYEYIYNVLGPYEKVIPKPENKK